MKKFMLSFVVVLFIILLSFSNSKADWIDKGQYFEMDSTYGEIKDFKISEDGQIWAVNAQNEILNINFANGKLIKRFKCEVDSNLKYKKISKDATNTIFVSYLNHSYPNMLVNVRIQIYENKSNSLILDTLINIDFKRLDYVENFNFIDIDFSISNHLLLLNINYSGDYFIEPARTGSAKFNNFLILDCQKGINLIDLDLTIESYNINLNKNIEDFYFIGGEYSSLTNYSGDNSTSSNSKSYFQKYNVNDNKLEKLISFSYYSYYYHKSGEGNKSGNPSYFHQLLHPTNDSLLYLIFHNKLSNNDTILYTYNKFEKKYIDSIKIQENTRYYTNFKLDNKDFLHIINDKTYTIKLNNGTLITLDSLYFPENVYNNQFFNNGEQTFVFFTDNKSKLNYFTTENLKNTAQKGFYASKKITHINKDIEFTAITNLKNCKFIWEIDGNKIETKEKTIKFKFDKFGEYDIQLIIKSELGFEIILKKNNYIIIKDSIKADFYFTHNYQNPALVFFNNNSKNEFLKSTWVFDVMAIKEDVNSSYEFIYNGKYNVSLIVEDELMRDTITKEIIITKYKNKIELRDPITYQTLGNYYHNSYRFSNILKNEFGYFLSHYYVKYNEERKPINKEHNLLNIDINNKYYQFSNTCLEPYKYQMNNLLYINNTTFISNTYECNNNKINKIFINKIFSNFIVSQELVNADELSIIMNSNDPLYFSNKGEQFYIIHNNKTELYTNNLQFNGKKNINLNFKTPHIRFDAIDDIVIIVDTDTSEKKLFFYKYDKSLKLLDKINIDLPENFTLVNIKFQNQNTIWVNGIKYYGTTPNAYLGKLNLANNDYIDSVYTNIGIIEQFEFYKNKYIIGTGNSRIKNIDNYGYYTFDTNLVFLSDTRLKKSSKNYFLKFFINNNKVDIFSADYDWRIFNIVSDTLYDSLYVSEDISNIETNNQSKALIFPNPSSEKISLDLGGVAVADLVIYDILGNVIMSFPNYTNKSEIDISTLSIGTYTIQIQTNTGSISQRLLVNR